MDRSADIIIIRVFSVRVNNFRSTRFSFPFEACGYFAVEGLAFRDGWELDLSDRMFRIGVVCEGSASVNGLAVRRGESFLLPYSLETCGIRGSGRIMFILPPRS